MVPRADLTRAQAILLDVDGVHPKRPNEEARELGAQDEDIETGCGKAEHAPPVLIRDLAIELHWTIAFPTGSVRIEPGSLWDRAQPALIAGVEVLSLPPEDLLLHLCLHFCYHHGCVGMRYLCDIAESIDRFGDKMNWPEVAERAHKWRASRYAGLALYLARNMLRAEVPGDLLERLVPGGIDQRVLEAARESVLTQTDYRQRVPLFLLLGARSLEDKAKLSWKRVFLSRDEMAAKYPATRGSKHFYLYYALRLRDVIRTYTFHTFRRGR
jgi:hypothetical protein